MALLACALIFNKIANEMQASLEGTFDPSTVYLEFSRKSAEQRTISSDSPDTEVMKMICI